MTQAPMPAMPASPVTLLDIYTRQVEMGTQLAVMAERLNTLPDHEARLRHLQAGKADAAAVTRLGERVGRLESARAKLAGLMLAAGLVEGAAGYWIGSLVGHH